MADDDFFLSICHIDGEPLGDDSIILTCDHRFHQRCIQAHLFRCQDSNSPLSCPVCSHELTREELTRVDPSFSGSTTEEVHTCPQCGIGFFYEPGYQAGITTDPKGRPIRADALECLRTNRCTCPACRTTHCVSCHARPFHDGYTCAEQSLKDRGIVCRFCEEPAGCNATSPVPYRICESADCRLHLLGACSTLLPCGHPCCGLRDETAHLGCAECDGLYCGCGEPCSLSPSLLLACGHQAHLLCVRQVYAAASRVGRIRIPRCLRPGCRALPSHPAVADLEAEWAPVIAAIELQIPRIIADEGIERERDHVNNPECEEYFHKPLEYARDIFVFYMCEKCGQPFYGGHADCGAGEAADASYACARCSRLLVDTRCPTHGDEQMLYKCFWCCRPALFFCWGTTHFCAECHERPLEVVKPPWPQCDGKCQFHPHAPNGTKKIVGYCTSCEAERARRGARR